MYGIAAYGWWGLIAIYFKLVKHVPALYVLAHRIVWSVAFLMILVIAQRRWPEIKRCLRSPRVLLVLAGSTTALAINWLTFIWAVSHDLVVQASLGYFVTPLVSVLMGMIFLRERLRPWQAVGLAIAAVGVTTMVTRGHEPPWVALLLALSFSTYGLLRKTMSVGPLIGTTVETMLLLPLGMILVGRQISNDLTHASVDTRTYALLLCAGVVTAVPLLWFAAAARRLRLATMGFLQYLAPTGQFLLAVFAFGEPFRRYQLISFTLIWLALAIYTVDSWQAYQSTRGGDAPPDA